MPNVSHSARGWHLRSIFAAALRNAFRAAWCGLGLGALSAMWIMSRCGAFRATYVGATKTPGGVSATIWRCCPPYCIGDEDPPVLAWHVLIWRASPSVLAVAPCTEQGTILGYKRETLEFSSPRELLEWNWYRVDWGQKAVQKAAAELDRVLEGMDS